MFLVKARVGSVLAAVAAAVLAGVPGAAIAQQQQGGGLIEFLWGGEPEYGGGKRQVVSFNSQYKAGQIIVSFGDRRLYHITKTGQATSYPIAIPREQSRWQGNTVVSNKRENPDWRPTPDMLKENPKLPSWVPGGHPMNPLGVRALYLGSSTYRIHGTDAPWTIGQNVSKGCIRMFNEDVIDLYPRVPTGTKVVVTWERFKTNGVETAAASERDTTPISGHKSLVRAKAAAPPKPGFFEEDVAVDDTAAPSEDEEVTVYTRNSDGTYSSNSSQGSDDSEELAAPAKQNGEEKVSRFNRKIGGGAVSRSAQTAVE